MNWTCLSPHPDGTVLRLRVTPKAAQTRPEGLRQDRLHLRVKAPPVEGQANAEAARWVAECFGLRASRLTLLRGQHAREKDWCLQGITPERAAQCLDRLWPDGLTPIK